VKDIVIKPSLSFKESEKTLNSSLKTYDLLQLNAINHESQKRSHHFSALNRP
jgi:hypothetical protein